MHSFYCALVFSFQTLSFQLTASSLIDRFFISIIWGTCFSIQLYFLTIFFFQNTSSIYPTVANLSSPLPPPPQPKKQKFCQNTTYVEILCKSTFDKVCNFKICILWSSKVSISVDVLEKLHYYVVNEPAHCQKVQIIFIIARWLNVKELIHQYLYRS